MASPIRADGSAIVRVEEPLHGIADVALIGDELVDDRPHVTLAKSTFGFDHQVPVQVGVPSAQPISLARGRQPLSGVLANDLQHGETRLSGTE